MQIILSLFVLFMLFAAFSAGDDDEREKRRKSDWEHSFDNPNSVNYEP